MRAIGNADPAIAAKVRGVFEQRCVELLKWACEKLKREKSINTDWGEENITANLYTSIHNSQQSVDYDIHPECEHSFFSTAILENKKNAKSATRIDLVFQHNWNGKRFMFFVEAKNLIETDVQKAGQKTKTRAVKVIERYIETGIDHYLNEHYPLGCLLGYLLNGTVAGVVNTINATLTSKMRSGEALTITLGNGSWTICRSLHIDKDNKKVQIDHYLFDFT